MREIKFRAWLKEERKMVNVETLFIGINRLCFGNSKTEDLFFRDFEEVELMQYTGLKDKNGKEIYEGDIVVLNNIENDNMCIVRYEHSSYRLEGWSLREDLSNVEDRFLEVVGNIYENKNLLEESRWANTR